MKFEISDRLEKNLLSKSYFCMGLNLKLELQQNNYKKKSCM